MEADASPEAACYTPLDLGRVTVSTPFSEGRLPLPDRLQGRRRLRWKVPKACLAKCMFSRSSLRSSFFSPRIVRTSSSNATSMSFSDAPGSSAVMRISFSGREGAIAAVPQRDRAKHIIEHPWTGKESTLLRFWPLSSNAELEEAS